MQLITIRETGKWINSKLWSILLKGLLVSWIMAKAFQSKFTNNTTSMFLNSSLDTCWQEATTMTIRKKLLEVEMDMELNWPISFLTSLSLSVEMAGWGKNLEWSGREIWLYMVKLKLSRIMEKIILQSPSTQSSKDSAWKNLTMILFPWWGRESMICLAFCLVSKFFSTKNNWKSTLSWSMLTSTLTAKK